MKRLLILTCLPLAAAAQIQVNYSVNTAADTHAISPFIYGSCNGGYNEATIRRQGGNRITGYNWENGASNAGADYNHQSDDYLLWISGIPSANYNTPGIVTTDFHDKSLQANAESAVTLQMAGYVARDRNGTSVSSGEVAPSNRWDQVVNHKPTAFSLTPDLNDGVVYTDEYIHFLMQHYGNAASPNGIKAFIMDNEPGLWPSTHPRIHPGANNCNEHLTKSIALAKTIRQMDATAEIWGPEAYGYNEYRTFQDANDWSTYSGQYAHYLEVYLDSMRHASEQVGTRLLNALTVHWYPDVYAGSVYSTDVSPTIARERMQIPRTLWDSTYVENGWIGQWFSQDLPILPKLQSFIQTYYPGTKLGITEYDYGGDAHISGGIAQVEALSAFIRTGTSYATKWGAFSEYSLSAIRLFRNVAEPFGDVRVKATVTDRAHTGIVASTESEASGLLHLIVTNRDEDSTISAHFNLASSTQYDSLQVYYFGPSGSTIQSTGWTSIAIQNGGFNYDLQPLTVYHFVLKTAAATNAVQELQDVPELHCFPNPVKDAVNVAWDVNVNGKIELLDVLGNTLKVFVPEKGQQQYTIPMNDLVSGTYFVRFRSGEFQVTQTIVK